VIITRLMGGHSNQLFQYAAGRRLAAKRGTQLKLDINTYFDNQPPENTPREYELGEYPLKATIASKQELELIPTEYFKESRLEKLRGRFGGRGKLRAYNEEGQFFHPEVSKLPDNTYLNGFWQNEKYFIDIRDDLLKELEPKSPMNAKNQNYLKQIKTSQAVSLHVRRDDYISNKNANQFHGLAPMEYYHKAFELIRQKTGSRTLQLFVFSTDLDWCQKNLKFDVPMTFVEGNQKGSDDMRLMKHCQHNIVANSSFSWWGAWLNKNPRKIVVAPKRWFQNEEANKEAEIVPSGWIRL